MIFHPFELVGLEVGTGKLVVRGTSEIIIAKIDVGCPAPLASGASSRRGDLPRDDSAYARTEGQGVNADRQCHRRISRH